MSIIEKRFSSSEDEGHMILMRLRVVGFVMVLFSQLGSVVVILGVCFV